MVTREFRRTTNPEDRGKDQRASALAQNIDKGGRPAKLNNENCGLRTAKLVSPTPRRVIT